MKTYWAKLASCAFGLFLLALFAAHGTSQCLTPKRIQQMAASMKARGNVAKNEKLRKELISLKKEVLLELNGRVAEQRAMRRISSGRAGGEDRLDSLDAALAQRRTKAQPRLCEILNTSGFPGKSLVGDEGVAAAFYLLKQFLPIPEQIKLVPVINAAIDTGELPKNDDYAAFVDRLRIAVGLKQLYGTQAFVRGNFLILSPIANEASLAQRRAELKMGPLEDYIKYLELLYRMPLIRERVGTPVLKPTVADAKAEAQLTPPELSSEEEVIRVTTELVDLNVHVLSRSPSDSARSLAPADFVVLEDGVEQEISLFNKTDTPFDLILLLDLSGSTLDKADLIRKATRRFIDNARPMDRISVITFTDRTKVVSPLTGDKDMLIKSLEKIDDVGFSYVWDGLLFALDKGFANSETGRRRAVVMMSDGVDNALGGRDRGSRTSFANLVERIRESDALIVPVFLDTFDPAFCGRRGPDCEFERMYDTARETLSVVAEESGGQIYYAQRLEDLEGIYQTVLADLATVYSIGYVPSNERRDGGWRSVKVLIKNRPNLTARARRGYYSAK